MIAPIRYVPRTADTDVDAGWEDALRWVSQKLVAGEPFCHLRFGDGEFDAVTDYHQLPYRNSDGHPFYPEVGRELAALLAGIAALRADPSPANHLRDNLVVGGSWVNGPWRYDWLDRRGYIRGIDWTSATLLVQGVVSGASLAAVRALVRLGDAERLWLAGPPHLRLAGHSNNPVGPCRSRLIMVPPSDSWSALDDVVGFVRGLPAGSVVIYCAGFMAKVAAWRGWHLSPDLTHFDAGHFFDRACGRNNRLWLESPNPRRDAYDRDFVPLLRG